MYVEFRTSTVDNNRDVSFSGAKEEVLANLANFAYDPVNYEFIRTLNVVGLFLGKKIIWRYLCTDSDREIIVYWIT